MNLQTPVATDIPADLVYSGKVRDTYRLADGHLLMIASDRISAFDVVLPNTVPGKGIVLTQLSRYWFGQLDALVPNHLARISFESLGWPDHLTAAMAPRAMIVREATRIPIECVVRGYLAGSGWNEYRTSGQIAGHALPGGLGMSSQLPEPIFTPARKNDSGHDENISVAQMADDIGAELTDALITHSLAIYNKAAGQARERGIIIADTKFEFGFIDDEIHLIDEVLTPDSSRFWDAVRWKPGHESESFDKQFVRNWLLSTDWNREPPGPELPSDVIAGTIDRYIDAFQRLTGVSLETWLATHGIRERQ